jgi:hypothetical protein
MMKGLTTIQEISTGQLRGLSRLREPKTLLTRMSREPFMVTSAARAGEVVECVVKAGWAVEDKEPRPSKSTQEQEEPKLLYHYTTQEGLLGIIEKECIWATHLRYLNDTSEGAIVSHAIWEELNSRVNADSLMQFLGIPPVKDKKRIQCDDEEILSQGNRILSEVTSRDVYVTSLSKQGNLLSQWRAYSGKSGGYSIGFSLDYLKTIGRHFLGEISRKSFLPGEPLIPCQYYDNKVRKQLTKKIQKSVDSYISEAKKTKREFTSGEQIGSRTPAAIAIRHFRPLSLECAITKDYAFHEEQEWRLVFRLLNYLLRMYSLGRVVRCSFHI